ncbi:MAG: transposase [Gammaproteobacteria bacterium]|nr:transposase [Gammaproteobacteria bacterium]
MDEIARINPKHSNKRREFSPEFKQRVIQESFEANASVAMVARRHDLNANLLFKWRYLHKKKANVSNTGDTVQLLPVSITSTPHQPSAVTTVTVVNEDTQPHLEIDLKTGRLFLQGCIDPSTLQTIIEAIRSC